MRQWLRRARRPLRTLRMTAVSLGRHLAFALLATCLSLAGCMPHPNLVKAPAADQSLVHLATRCAGRDGWSDPAPPAHIFGNTWYVGTCGISAILVTSTDGHVLVDAGMADAAPQVAANIERLGFRRRDVRWIVNSHEHFDHAGGLAAIKRLTGARLAALPAAIPALQSGHARQEDPQFQGLKGFAPVHVDRPLRDGDVVAVGSARLVARATPGHAPGSTTWTWRACEAGSCRTIVYADSVTAIASAPYRFSDHPEAVATLRASLARVETLPCDILITPHPGASALFERFAGDAPLVDAQACRNYAETGRSKLDAVLQREQGQTP